MNLLTTVYFVGYFFMRRLLFAVIAVYVGGQPYFQIQAYSLLSLLNCIFIFLAKPFESRQANYSEIFNEITILGVSVHLFVFSDLVDDVELYTMAGYSLIGIVMINVTYHLLNMITHTLRSLL